MFCVILSMGLAKNIIYITIMLHRKGIRRCEDQFYASTRCIPYVLESIRFKVEVPSNPWPLLLLLSLLSSHLVARSLFYSFIFFSTGFNCFCPHADDTFQIQDWLRSNGNHDRGYPEFDYHHRIRPLSPVKRQRISATTDGKGPDRRRQLKSMESLLGLSDENLNGKNLVRDINAIQMYYVRCIAYKIFKRKTNWLNKFRLSSILKKSDVTRITSNIAIWGNFCSRRRGIFFDKTYLRVLR